tara:strand:+ start:1129 stop:1242 length:114 start_codon:yes stop_codon:yes gene_type:complete
MEFEMTENNQEEESKIEVPKPTKVGTFKKTKVGFTMV